jgi:Protein of unknown function (DUF1566)
MAGGVDGGVDGGFRGGVDASSDAGSDASSDAGSDAGRRFTIAAVGVVQDNAPEGRQWQSQLPSMDTAGCGTQFAGTNVAACTWFEAVEYCQTLTLGGYDDWNMPTLEQLQSLLDAPPLLPSNVDTALFPDTPSAAFWALESASSTSSYGVSFHDHQTRGYSDSSDHLGIRCVR